MIAILKDALASQELVSIYADPSRPGSCSVGKIYSIGKTVFAMKSMTQDGRDDGILLRKVENVFKIEGGGKYEKKIGFLHEEQLRLVKDRTYDLKQFADFSTALRYASKQKFVISVWMEMDDDDEYQSGYISSITTKTFKLDRLDDFGIANGFSVLKIEYIQGMDIDGSNERALNVLHSSVAKIY
jgi:hypothetical protein